MTYTIVDSLPFPRFSVGDVVAKRLVHLAALLSCTGSEMWPYWDQLASEGWVPERRAEASPGIVDAEERVQTQAEIEGVIAHDVFGLSRSELEFILDGFAIVRKSDEEAYGEFRTKRLILGKFDAASSAHSTGALSIPTLVLQPVPDAAVSEPFSRVRPSPGDRYRRCVPLLSLKAAAGAFGGGQLPEFEDWVELATATSLTKGMFVAQVIGRSMHPLIHDGAYCLFRYPVLKPKNDMTILAQHHGINDTETGGSYTVKRLHRTGHETGEGWQWDEVRLEPVNSEFSPIILRNLEEGELRVLAEFIEVLTASP